MKKKLLITIPILMLFYSCANKSQEDLFWNWFEKNNLKYYENADQILKKKNLLDDLTSELKKINEDLVFEFSPINENGIRNFTISADGLIEAFPSVENLIKVAPEIDNWKINAFRQRTPGEDLTIEFHDFKISYSDIFYKYSETNEKLGLEFYIRDYNGNGQKQNAIYILLDALIGEYDAVKIIEWIEWNKLNESEIDSLIPFVTLRKLIDDKK